MQQRLWLALALAASLLWPAAQAPAPVRAAACTDDAELVDLESDPASGIVAPDATFTVVWTVRNAGDCTWDRTYRTVFVSGDRLDGARTSRLRERVAPGATLTLALDLTAPTEPGDYTGVWRLRSPDGATFGPDLTAAVQVADLDATDPNALTASGASEPDVVLPEVLAFGGLGGGGDGEIDPCLLADGSRFEGPGLLLEDAYVATRRAPLYLCGYATDSTVTVELTNPDGTAFRESYTIGEPVTYTDAAGMEYEQTSVLVYLRWPDRAPGGAWDVHITDGEFEEEHTLMIPAAEAPIMTDTWVDEMTDPCRFTDGSRFTGPGLLVDDQYDRYATLTLCGYAAGSELTVELASPTGDIYSTAYLVGEPASYVDAGGTEYDQTSVGINVNWPNRAPAGAWGIYVTGGEADQSYTVEIQEFSWPMLETYPVAPVNPFVAERSCGYGYLPDEEMVIFGENLPPDMDLTLGFYQSRLYTGYLVNQLTAQSEADGTLTLPFSSTVPGEYHVYVLQAVDPEGYAEDGVTYLEWFGEESATTCFTVLPEDGASPLRLAFARGEPDASDVLTLDLDTGYATFPAFGYGTCSAADPAWWPDGEWVVYTTNCVVGEVDAETGFPEYVSGAYDLYGVPIAPDPFNETEEESIQLTATPDLDETEPHVDGEGYIVYRQAPAGAPYDASGELWVLDPFEEEYYDLGLTGRAPVWSPDGLRVAFMSDLEGPWQIYVYDIEEEAVWLATEDCPSHCRFPAWSPDGEQLIFSTTRSQRIFTPNGLWRVAAEGGAPEQWLEGEYDHPTWSEEGWVAFTGPDGIYRARADARAPVAERYLYASDTDFGAGTFTAPVWSR